MKYEIIDTVSRYVKRFGMIMDPETMNKARDEAEEYDFRLISPGHYAVQHKDKMYVIIERDGEIGCSCDDMSYNRMDGSVCKHIIAFTRLMTPVTKAIEGGDAAYLMNSCGWTGAELHPEVELGGPGAVIQEDTKPTPKASIPPDPDLGVNDPLPEEDEDKPLDDHGDRSEEPEQKQEEVKKMENKPAWDQEAWDSATQGSFVSYNEDGIATLIFTSNDFEVGKPDKWGRVPCEFSVIQNKKSVILSGGAIGLMHALKEILPLEGKVIRIIRTGEGTGTKYEVQDMTDTEVIE
ncbi:MAG: hypothetical protein ACXQS5_01325 [Candidatus Methanospirareceae archaeon]